MNRCDAWGRGTVRFPPAPQHPKCPSTWAFVRVETPHRRRGPGDRVADQGKRQIDGRGNLAAPLPPALTRSLLSSHRTEARRHEGGGRQSGDDNLPLAIERQRRRRGIRSTPSRRRPASTTGRHSASASATPWYRPTRRADRSSRSAASPTGAPHSTACRPRPVGEVAGRAVV